MDNVQCTGDEEGITECVYDNTTDCEHSEDAGVVCGGKYTAIDEDHELALGCNVTSIVIKWCILLCHP